MLSSSIENILSNTKNKLQAMNLKKFHELIDTGDVSKIDAFLVVKGNDRKVDMWTEGDEDLLTAMIAECCKEDVKIHRIIRGAALLAMDARTEIPEGGVE